ncbi:protease modulator HflC [Paraburkholderia phosphatilytica]|uniref:protease modulator HflC n=1 Tax=Paraburkholderia phosphatilytica TaxID=2282883 RepID=UPI000E4A7A1D|nr:protease modulator HflC [Paraburkholderia phosphatilytica]
MNKIIALVVAIVVVLYAVTSMVFIVDQRHVAVVSGRGDETTLAGPGLHVKLPAPLQTVTYIDTRVLTVDAPDEDRYTTSDKIELLVNPVIRYRVTDPMKLIGETKGDVQSLPERLALLSRNALGDAFAKDSLTDALAKQDQIGNDARDGMQKAAASLGVDVLGVQLSRVDFPPAMADTVYKRMIAAREQIAAQERAKGTSEAEQIKADADRQQQAQLADAYDQAQSIKGDGDAKAAAIAAEAYGRDPQFYQFYQSMQAYRDSFKPGDVIVVDSSSDFFRFMRNPAGDTTPPAAPETPRKH